MNLKLPEGICIPKETEYPNGYDVIKITQERNNALIIPGYKITSHEGKKFNASYEINVNAPDLWQLFWDLSNAIISNQAYFIIGLKDDDNEDYLSDFMDKSLIASAIEKYRYSIVNDGFLSFGIAYYDDTSLNEVYIDSFKFLKVWTTQQKAVNQILLKHKLEMNSELRFIDEFPVISLSLANEEKGILHTTGILTNLKKEFHLVQLRNKANGGA